METPYYRLYHKHPDYNSLKAYGCKCFPYFRQHGHKKFEKKIYPCLFISYSSLHKGYKCLKPEINKVYMSSHVVFAAKEFSFSTNLSSNTKYSKLQESLTLTTFLDKKKGCF